MCVFYLYKTLGAIYTFMGDYIGIADYFLDKTPNLPGKKSFRFRQVSCAKIS